WYSSMFAANIKQEPISHHHHHHHAHHSHHAHDSNSNASNSPHQSPLPSPNPPSHTNLQLEQYLKQQQQQQQQHQHQQQQQPMDTLCAAAMTPSFSNNDQNSRGWWSGLPNPMQTIMPANMRPSPTATAATTATDCCAPTTTAAAIALQANDKLQALTPPMDVTPPKSPAKSQQSCAEPEKEHDLMSNSSEDMKYMA
uniref:Protein hunchback (Fragments) n=1 Tax=Drosophila adunca TaxID=46893 RepID=HUNB_DROAA|nr:RecName: Full=Protein hunchback [Drosophila adunca]